MKEIDNPHVDHEMNKAIADTAYNILVDDFNEFLRFKGLEREFDLFCDWRRNIKKSQIIRDLEGHQIAINPSKSDTINA